jgi:Flp pilus assembly protein TadG
MTVALSALGRSRRLAREESGTSMVEFALVAPMLIALLVGLIEIGRFAYFAILAANAARAGVQYGAQNLQTAADTTGITNAVVADGQNLPNWTASGGHVLVSHLCSVNGATPTICVTGASGPAPNTVYYVSVQVTGSFKSLLSYPGLPPTLPVSGNAIMRVASQ